MQGNYIEQNMVKL